MPMPVLIQPRRFRPARMIAPLLFVGALAAVTWSRSPATPAVLFSEARPLRRGTAVQALTFPGGRDAAGALRSDALLAGETMGTVFHIRLIRPGLAAQALDRLVLAIEDALVEVNRQMSPYQPDSEISRFNRADAGEAVPISPAFARVIAVSLDLSRASGGAFDPTVAPLVNLWGFGTSGRREQPPDAAEVSNAFARVGWRHVEAAGPQALRKARAGVELDLSAVAKGYGVDAAADTLTAAGVTNFFVEVGGEVRASGFNAAGRPWRIGIDRPRRDALPGDDLEGVLHLTRGAVATSGDYRNFLEGPEGRAYAHIFDPRAGRPIESPPTSVSVLAPDCLLADGLATTLFVMGPEDGLAWLPRHYPQAEALFVVRQPDGFFREYATPGFQRAGGYALPAPAPLQSPMSACPAP